MVEFNYSWRDEYGSDMDKAKALLADESVTGIFISNVAGISRQSVSNYRTGKTSIETANWITVTMMARAYEADYIQKKIGDKQNDFVLFIKKLGKETDKWADSLENKGDEDMCAVVDRLNEMTSSDILQLIDLYTEYTDDGDDGVPDMDEIDDPLS